MTHLGELSAGSDRRLASLVRCYGTFWTMLSLGDGSTIRVFCQVQEFCRQALHAIPVGPAEDRLAAVRDLHAVAVTLATLLDRYSIAHRDLVGNIMVAEDGSWRLTDFGYAVHFDTRSRVVTQVVGKQGCWPPEHYTAGVTGTSRSWDTWLFAYVMYQRLTGAAPFRTPEDVLLHRPGPELEQLPPDLREVFLDASAVDPVERLPMSQTAARLGEFLVAEEERRRQAEHFSQRVQQEVAAALDAIRSATSAAGHDGGDLDDGRPVTAGLGMGAPPMRWTVPALLLFNALLFSSVTTPLGGYLVEALGVYFAHPRQSLAAPPRRGPGPRLRFRQRTAVAAAAGAVALPGVVAVWADSPEQDRWAEQRARLRAVHTTLYTAGLGFVNTRASRRDGEGPMRLELGPATLGTQPGTAVLTVPVLGVESDATTATLSWDCRRSPAPDTVSGSKTRPSIAPGPYLLLTGTSAVPPLDTASPSYSYSGDGGAIRVVPAPCPSPPGTDPAAPPPGTVVDGAVWTTAEVPSGSAWKPPQGQAPRLAFAVPEGTRLPPPPVDGLRPRLGDWPDGTAVGIIWVADSGDVAIAALG